MNQNIKTIQQKLTKTLLARQRTLVLLKSPRKLQTALQMGLNGMITRLPQSDRDLLLKLGLLRRITIDNTVLTTKGLTWTWNRSFIGDTPDFTASPNAAIDSSLDVIFSFHHQWKYDNVVLTISLMLWHKLSAEDEMTLRSINVIRTEYEPQRSSIVVSCELPDA